MNRTLLWFLPVSMILWVGAGYNYPLFHALADFWAIGIALLAGCVGLATYPYTRNRLIAGIGMVFLAVCALDLLHTLASNGVAFFPSFTADEPMQLWILARWVQCFGLFLVLVLHRRERFLIPFGIFLTLASAAGFACVFFGYFPACCLPGSGLTHFKIISEVEIAVLLVAVAVAILRSSDPWIRPYRKVFVAALFFAGMSEMAFAAHVEGYSPVNLAGHIFKIASYWVLFKGFLLPSVRDPLFTLFGPLLSDREALLGAMTGPSGILDRGGAVLAANKHLQPSRSSEKAGTSQSVSRLLPGTGRIISEELRQVVAKGEARHFEFVDNGKAFRAGLYPMPSGGTVEEGQYAFISWDVTGEKRVRKELDLTRDSLVQAQEMALLGTFRVELPSGNVVFSESLGKLMALSPDERVDFDWYLSHIYEGDRDRVKAIRQSALESDRKEYRLECRIRRADGVLRNFKVWVRVERNGKDDPTGLVGTIQDHTDQVRLRRELESSEERYRSYIEKAPIGVLVLNVHGRIVEVNQADTAITGYSREELLNMEVTDLYPSDQRETAMARFHRLRSDETHLYETPFIRRDGTRGHWQVHAVPLPDGTYMALVQDLSVRYEALERARLSQERYKSLFETILEGFSIHEAILDSEGDLFDYRFIEVNPAFETLTGLSAQSVLGKTARDVFSNLEGHWFQTFSKVVRTGKSVRFTGYVEELDRWYEVLAFPTGKNGFATAFRDVSREHEHEEALEMMNWQLEAHVAELEKAWEQTIDVLADLTEFRDPYTSGHQRRVAEITEAICQEMGFDEDATSETVRAALIHDIGKIQIPSDFLSKPGRLSEKEMRIIRKHPRGGANLLGGIDLPWPLGDIVRQHHERMDGSGYPNGLKGDEILHQARIIAVADVVEAMASARPYRPALGIGAALGEIEKWAGVKYDADVVAACLRIFREKGFELPVR